MHLQNKARCIFADLPDSPLTCIDLWCRGGSYFEKEGEEGLAHLLEHIIFKGSSKLKEGEFDKRIEALGGSSNAATGLDDVHYYVLVPGKDVPIAIDLLLNLVLTPTFEKNPYLVEKEVVIEEISQNKDQPEEKVFQILLENCWPKHPYGRPILGFEDSIKTSNPEGLKAFHKRRYQPANLSLGIAGTIPENIESLLNKSDLGKINTINQETDFVADSNSAIKSFLSGRKEIGVERLESARISMAWPLPPAKDQLIIMGADIATTILAEGRSSRLVKHLRENLQIVDSIEMDITALEQGGIVLLEATCLEKDLVKVETEINFILQNSLTNAPSFKELERAKQLVINSICFGLELTTQIAGISASQALWNRHQPLLEPLKHIKYWGSINIQNIILTKLQPEKSFTLISKPKKNNYKE